MFELPGFNVHESKTGDEKLFFERSGVDLTFFKQGIWDPLKSHLLLHCSTLAARGRLKNLVIPREVGYRPTVGNLCCHAALNWLRLKN